MTHKKAFLKIISRALRSLLPCTLLAPFSPLSAQVTEYQGQTSGGAYYSIALPAQWQPADGLVIWNHGYQGYTSSEPDSNPSLGPLEDVILSQGYAMAASSYRQTGWAVFDSHEDNLELYEKFVELAAVPDRLFLQGASLGGIVSVRDLEASLLPEIDGALLMCGAVAGAKNWYEAYDLRMVYEAVCNDVSKAELPTASWSEEPDRIRGELDFLDSLQRCTGLSTTGLIGGRLGELFQSDAQKERLEKILRLTNTHQDFLLLNLGYAVFEIPRLVNDEGKLAGARPFGNLGIDYGDDEVNMRAPRSIALPSATRRFLANYSPSGSVRNSKIVSIHTSQDGLVKVENQQTLRQLVAPELLTQAIVVEEKPSHCGFTNDEGIAAWNSLVDWVDGGQQPGPEMLQSKCLLTAASAADCRFDPDFVWQPQLLTFPREASGIAAGTSFYDSANATVLIDRMSVLGGDQDYRLTLAAPNDAGGLFTIERADSLPSTSEPVPEYRASYSPSDQILFIPDLSILPLSAGARRYDVYMRYLEEAGNTGLELLEIE
ncbi:MAG: hypothetical protein DHS20C12_30420 [Pseudohongiella sp.]|nr:MAG: hypothetical protein DHS20C12_30420 [Pseudohongiella sp.]